ncbi:unnamed protein product [Taenia asiatica]|uniref:Secreted protein n=1 Tax=Taenia asiatica TaxID=60517 RepID=A0A0R3VYV8_TAEAS|nr:unnamed protein product [Taenia asiatica]
MCLTKCGCADRRTSIEFSEMLYCFCYTAAFQAESRHLCQEDYTTSVTTTTRGRSDWCCLVSTPPRLPTVTVR